MSGFNKNFVVKNGIEVSTNLIYADLNQDAVGIGTTTTPEKLQVNGGIGATSIVVTGIGTFPTVKGEDLYYNDAFINTGVVTSITGTISTYTTSNTTTLNATTGNIVTGVVTSISGTDLTYNDGHFSIVNTGTDSVDNLYAVSGIITTATITNGTVTNLAGTAATIGTVQIASGIVTSATGIVTYYGDGQYLNLTANPSRGIGIATVGGVVGYAATFINFYGAGISTSLFDSSVGIATIYFEAAPAPAIATQIEITNETASASTHYLTFSAGTSGAQSLKVDSSTLTYVPSTNTITANLSGTASNATNTAITDETGSVSTHYITFVTGTSGNQAQKVDSTGLTYIPSTNTLSGNISGNAATVTTNANLTGDITSVGNATAIASGVIVDADISGSAAISVSKLAASTISGVTLGNNLATLTIGTYLTGSNYNGSAGQTWAVDATSANTASKVVARDANGDFAARNITCVDLNSTSDINLKDDIRPFENALATVNQLNGVHFTWKEDNRKSVGVIAQEIDAILPELVTETNGIKTVNYNGLIGILIEAVKELSEKVEKLENK